MNADEGERATAGSSSQLRGLRDNGLQVRRHPVLVSQTQQQRSDRVVGDWSSSSGADITLAYTGKAESLWIQVFPKPGRADPRVDYTARWLSNDLFTYTDRSGSTIEGRVSATGTMIELRGADGWSGTWRRRR